MRVAIANTARNYGGQEAMAALLAEQLRARGHEVVFLCRPVFPALERLRSRVVVEPVLGGIDWSPRSIWRARKVLRRHSAQVMLVTTNKDMRSAALAAWSLGVPVVVRRAMARPLRPTPHYRFLYGVLPHHVVTNSHATRKILLDSASWIDPGRTSVIYNGIDPHPFREAEPADLGIPSGALAIGFVGRFVEWKGVLTVADAWKRMVNDLPDVHLALVGEGEMEAEMRSRLAGADRVHWVGFRRDIPSVMRALDVLAFPSTMEGFGLAAVEAMAAGVPVIGARAGSLPEVIGEEAGVLIPPEDSIALAHAMTDMVHHPERRHRMGQAGQERVRREFTFDRMLDEYELLLSRVVSNEERSTSCT